MDGFFICQNLKKMGYEAYIFDLGGVIIDIDYDKTAEAFKKLGCDDFDNLYSQASQSLLFDKFETGQISGMAFVNKLLDYLPPNISANRIVEAWNAMILDFPLEKLYALEKLAQKKPIYLLSNTNEIHIQKVLRKYRESNFHVEWGNLFSGIYLSHEIKLRKPNTEVFDFVCNKNGLNPATTLFFDDTLQHVEGARKAGLNAVHLKSGESFTDYLS